MAATNCLFANILQNIIFCVQKKALYFLFCFCFLQLYFEDFDM